MYGEKPFLALDFKRLKWFKTLRFAVRVTLPILANLGIKGRLFHLLPNQMTQFAAQMKKRRQSPRRLPAFSLEAPSVANCLIVFSEDKLQI